MPLLLMLTTRNQFCDVYTTLNHNLTENYLFTNSERFQETYAGVDSRQGLTHSS